MDDQTDETPAGTGRLHGRLLQVLAAVSVLAALVAVWQLSPVLFRSDEHTSATWPWQDPATIDFAGEASSSEAAPTDSQEPSDADTEPSTEESSMDSEPESPAETSADEAAPSTEAAGTEAAPEPEGPACTASLRVGSTWGGSMEVWVQVVNTGSERLGGWEVALAFDGAEIAHHWGMDHVGGDRYESERWNGALAPGETADAAFHASTRGDVDLPQTVPCTALD